MSAITEQIREIAGHWIRHEKNHDVFADTQAKQEPILFIGLGSHQMEALAEEIGEGNTFRFIAKDVEFVAINMPEYFRIDLKDPDEVKVFSIVEVT